MIYLMYILRYCIYIYVCVCVYWEKERERDRDRRTDRQKIYLTYVFLNIFLPINRFVVLSEAIAVLMRVMTCPSPGRGKILKYNLPQMSDLPLFTIFYSFRYRGHGQKWNLVAVTGYSVKDSWVLLQFPARKSQLEKSRFFYEGFQKNEFQLTSVWVIHLIHCCNYLREWWSFDYLNNLMLILFFTQGYWIELVNYHLEFYCI